MMLAVALATLIAIPLLGLVTFVQLLYLESLRLRTRDLPALKFFKETLEDRLGLKTERGAGAFSLIKHTLLVLAGIFCFAWFADGEPWNATEFWQSALAVWLGMLAVAYALPQVLYRRTTGKWLLPLVPLLRGMACVARPFEALLSFFQSLIDLADDPADKEEASHARREYRSTHHRRNRGGPHRGGGSGIDPIGGGVRRQSGARGDDAAAQHRGRLSRFHARSSSARSSSTSSIRAFRFTRRISTR